MSVARVNRGWEFILPTDTEFVKKHPDVAQRQYMLWLGIQTKYAGGGDGGGRWAPSTLGDFLRQCGNHLVLHVKSEQSSLSAC